MMPREMAFSGVCIADRSNEPRLSDNTWYVNDEIKPC